MKKVLMLTVALGLLAGCDALNDTMVRRWHEDRQLGSKVNDQINEGYRKRMELPAPPASKTAPSPTGLDQG